MQEPPDFWRTCYDLCMIRIDELLMKLHRLIEAKRLTQEQLGKILGVKQSGVSRRLSGKTRLKIDEINILTS